MLKEYIEQLARDLPLVHCQVEEVGYSLFFEPTITVECEEKEDKIRLFSTLFPLPQERQEEFCLKALSANLFGRETGGGVLGLDQERNRVVFLTFLHDILNYRQFYNGLEDFLNYAEAWRDETSLFAKAEGP